MNTDKGYTDVVILTHGFMTGRNEDGSFNVVHRMVPKLEEARPGNVKPLYIGVKWPSLISTLAQSPGANNRARFEELVKILRESALAAEMSASTGDAGVSSLADMQNAPCVRAIAEFEQEALKIFIEENDSDESSPIPESVKTHLAKVADELALQGAISGQDMSSIIDDGEAYSADVQDLVEKHSERAAAAVKEIKDTAALDGMDTKSKTGRLLFLMQDVVFGQFERRASNVGSRGVHVLLAHLMRHAPRTVRFHLFGHSLGGHVACSAAIGRAPGSLLSRKVHSVVIAQGALDSKSLALGGGYRPIATQLLPVAGPFVETVVSGDFALRTYDFFHNAPAGRVGFKDSGPMHGVELKLKVAKGKPTQKFDFRARHCYNVESSDVITGHSDFYNLEVANLVWSAVKVRLPDEAYKVTDLGSLPPNYWTEFDVRAENDFRCCHIM